MRKNGIDRTLTPIEGGLCAPVGFSVSATRCGFLKSVGNDEDLALILTKRRYPAAFVGTNCANVGAHVRLSEKHMQGGFASAVLINGGIANDFDEKAEKLAENISRLFANKFNVDRNEMILITTGNWGEELLFSSFENGIQSLAKGFDATHKNSLASSRVLSTNGEENQCSFSFWLGDISCKIGGIFCGTAEGTLIKPRSNVYLLTTDVKISAKMLQKALKTAVNEHLYMIGGLVDTPNDCVGIIASGEAKNWEIIDNGSDYQKFVWALNSVFAYICRQIVGREDKRTILCKITGAKSKNMARNIAKNVLSSSRVKYTLCSERFDVQELLYVLLSGREKIWLNDLSILLRSNGCVAVVFEEKRTLAISKDTLKRIFEGEEIELVIALKQGNYTATSYGSL